MYGNCRYQARYKLTTRLRASSLSKDRMGFTCLTALRTVC